jgi:CheY-like chemotaxis protein
MDALMRDLAVILSANAAGKDIEVLFDIDPAVPRRLLGDAMRLQQVLINLGGNAIKFTAHGEVVVKVAVVERDEDKATLDVSVRDTGIGIAPEHHERIFSGFTQAEASTTRRYGGTGLGVAICQRLVRLMGGELRLDSAPGRGSRFHFRVTLPLAEAAPAIAPAPATALSVLIVDDNPSAREIMGAMAGSLGWRVELADSGESALARLQAEPGGFDAVFVDWQMPGLDGWQTCERIRAGAPAGKAPLVVMVTAHGREDLAQRSEQEQRRLDGFLVKPVTASMLLDAVTDARRETGAASPSEVRSGTLRRLAGLRLLVAEDNANNQQVARELLEDEGAEVQIAADGYAAVLAVAAAERPFDAVLMDLQMPVMDGYTATSEIRQRMGPKDLPIIAMTANAMASDREACLAAGMNDHVGKPFDLDHLVRVLRRLCGRDEAPPPARAPAAPVNDAVRQAAGEAGIDFAAALERLGGNEGAYRRLLRNFVADLAACPSQLRAQAEAGAWAEAGRQFHTLKGLGATLGLNGLAAQAAAAEKAIAGGLCDPAEPAWQGTLAALEAALPALQRFNQAFEEPAAAPADGAQVDAQALKASLQALSGLLADADMEALAVMDGLREQPAGTLAPRLAQLDEAVGRLDFDTALQACQALIDALPT